VRANLSEPENLEGFETSRWHRRGWTLQELLAPERVEFYDLDWCQFGTRLSLRNRIYKTTGIREEILAAKFDVEGSKNRYCVAEKMSWAANRKTTRIEDMAYCLLGIFDVNMPLLYGEGHRAFERLQFQVLAETDDLTLFAWEGPRRKVTDEARNTDFDILFAKSPSYFYEWDDEYPRKHRYQLCDAGLYIDVWKELKRLNPTGNSVPEPPVKRLGSLTLNLAIIPGSYTLPTLAVLCRTRRVAGGKGAVYLCLPLFLLGDSISFAKNGLPVPILLQDGNSEVQFKRISIRLQPQFVSLSNFQNEHRPAVILSLQREGGFRKQFFLGNHRYYSFAAVLLRYGPVDELLILCGWSKAFSGGRDRAQPWTVVRKWDELRDLYTSLPTEPNQMKPVDFHQRRLYGSTCLQCTIKPGVPGWGNWCLSQEYSIISGDEFQLFVEPPRVLYLLNVVVRSSEGRSEQNEFLGWKGFDHYDLFRDWMQGLKYVSRSALLADPQWRKVV
jgi:hypothetical protein